MKLLALFAVVLAVAGCKSGQVDKDIMARDASDPKSHGTQELTGGTLSTVPSWIVSIHVDGRSFCSASVLSEHYLLTAAHCVENVLGGYGDVVIRRASSEGETEIVYAGRAQFLTHPDYDILWPIDAEDDIALIRLLGRGINLSLTGRARIYIDYVNPIWTLPDPQSFTFAGWGLSDPSGNAECTSDTAGVLRIGSATGLERASRDQKDLTAPQGTTHLCPGDSGSPWLFARADDFLAFAVSTGWTFRVGGNLDKATSILPKFQWIYAASRQGGCNDVECFVDFLSCAPGGNLDDLSFHQCFERRHVTGVPPDPGTACPPGQHCCEPGINQCERCIPRNLHCP
jgi:hypothetical protein